MENWEKRYIHYKAVRDAQCDSLGIPIPKDEKYGVLKTNKHIWRSFIAKEFWPRLKNLGHTSAEFDRCLCKK